LELSDLIDGVAVRHAGPQHLDAELRARVLGTGLGRRKVGVGRTGAGYRQLDRLPIELGDPVFPRRRTLRGDWRSGHGGGADHAGKGHALAELTAIELF